MSKKKVIIGADLGKSPAEIVVMFEGPRGERVLAPARMGPVQPTVSVESVRELMRAAGGTRPVVPIVTPAEYRALVVEEEQRKKAQPERGRGIMSRAVRSTAGKRADLGFYVRSMAEANYARYLAWLLERGEIAGWAYELCEFTLPAMRKGQRERFYLPDFARWEKGRAFPAGADAPLPRSRAGLCGGRIGAIALAAYPPSRWDEVKFWLDAESKMKLRRMAASHPNETIQIVDRKVMARITKQVGGIIPGWEKGTKR